MLSQRTRERLCRLKAKYRGQRLPALTVRDVLLLENVDNTLFRIWNALDDLAVLIVGDRGSGKSLTEGLIAFADYMVLGMPCWSNLSIRYAVDIDEELERILREYSAVWGLPIKREPVVYESLPLDIGLLLGDNPPYKHGVIVVDEVNMEMGDAWRAMTNQALRSSDFMQTLRKLQSAFVCTCISESFVPNRIRDAMDVDLHVQDLAFSNSSPFFGCQQGYYIEWQVYAMSNRIAGSEYRYDQTGQPINVVHLNARKLWGSIDTWDRKRRSKYVVSAYGTKGAADSEEAKARPGDIQAEIAESRVVEDVRERWGWLIYHPFVQELSNSGATITNFELLDRLAEDIPAGIEDEEVLAAFERYLNPRKTYSAGRKYYSFGVRQRQRTHAELAAAPI